MRFNLRPPDAAPVLIPFNYDAHAKSGVAQMFRLIAFLLLIHYARSLLVWICYGRYNHVECSLVLYSANYRLHLYMRDEK